MIFNEVEATKAATSRPADYQNLQMQYEAAHASREQAALNFVSVNRQANEAATEAAKQSYLQADAQFNAARKNATEFIKTTNNDKSFNDVNYVFPTFVIANMPAGVIGLIIAAIFAAAMSSISAELNSLATATIIDFYRRHFKPEATDTHYVFAGRVATFFWGIFACIVAMYSTSLGSLIEVVNTFGSFFYGSLLGVFILAIAIPRARSRGAFFGLLFGILSVWISSRYLDIAFLWFNVVGCLATVIAGYLISLTVREDNNAIVE
jgi:Na+/proline symporter